MAQPPSLRGRTAAGTLAIAALAIVLAGAPALSATTPSPSPDTAGTTWAIAPATEGMADGRVSLRHTIEPGTSVQDAVIVTNYGPDAATYDVYASDGIVTADGNFDLIAPVEAPSDGGAWISFGDVPDSEPREPGGLTVQIPAETALAIPVEIAAPADSTPGDHPAGIVAELSREDANGVSFASRVGVRVHLRAAGDLDPRLTVENVEATWMPSWNPFAPGTVEITYTVANHGNVRVGADLAVRQSGPFDGDPQLVDDSMREVLPGQTAELTASVPTWPLVRAWGDIAASPTVVGEDEVDGSLLTTSSTPYAAWTLPWAQLCLVLIICALVFAVIAWRRYRARKWEASVAAAAQARRDAPDGERAGR
ncbi:hypothetical protein [Demequina sp. NBRC 110053]|uniref:COG1470 family protein n=1 Tax=Demequina sp. NBRC 110053 TaxID=1570342 RepID=UPI000A073DF3|nr:hypothetical protein [Demequina sp. NBRC 110053]